MNKWCIYKPVAEAAIVASAEVEVKQEINCLSTHVIATNQSVCRPYIYFELLG
jgi:hypothetical protein